MRSPWYVPKSRALVYHRVNAETHAGFPRGQIAIEHCRCGAWRARVSYGTGTPVCMCTDWSRECTGRAPPV